MKKSVIFTSFLCFILFIFLLPYIKVEGAIKLNQTNVNLTVGQSTQLKLSKAKRTVTWYSANKSVATVTKTGKVTAKSEGGALIIAIYGKKRYECTVTVNSALSASSFADSQLAVQFETVPTGVVAIVTNQSNEDYSLNTNLLLIKNNEIIKTSTATNYFFKRGTTSTFYFEWPKDSEQTYIAYPNYKVTFSKQSTKCTTDYSDLIKYKAAAGKNHTLRVVATNPKLRKIDYTSLSVIFYENDIPVGYTTTYLDDFKDSVRKTAFSLEYPKNEQGEYYSITSYKLYLNYAYSYTW